MKFLEMAFKVLSETKRPMSASEIWEFAVDREYVAQLETAGKTPQETLSARLYTAALDERNGKFTSVGARPKRFYLKNVTPKETISKFEGAEIEEKEVGKLAYLEKDLHQVLAHFIYNRLDAYPKTIIHTKSKKSVFAEWLHPDMVACSFPQQHWKTSTYELSQHLGDVQIALFSFEIKLRLSFGNLRESFFQAVSNSSWSHLGYLVAANIDKDKEFLEELRRLSNSFGIGVIELIPSDPDSSDFLFDAELRDHVDWDMVSKLTLNTDFAAFIERVRNDLQSREIRSEWYDRQLEAEEISSKFKG